MTSKEPNVHKYIIARNTVAENIEDGWEFAGEELNNLWCFVIAAD